MSTASGESQQQRAISPPSFENKAIEPLPKQRVVTARILLPDGSEQSVPRQGMVNCE